MEKYDIDILYLATITRFKRGIISCIDYRYVHPIKKKTYYSFLMKTDDGYYDLIIDRKYVEKDRKFKYSQNFPINYEKDYIYGELIPMRIYMKEAKEYLTIDEIRNLFYKLNNKKTVEQFRDKFLTNVMLTKKYIEDNIDGEIKNIYLERLSYIASNYMEQLIYISENDKEDLVSDCSIKLAELVKELDISNGIALIESDIKTYKKGFRKKK